jgi:hypothetical protein
VPAGHLFVIPLTIYTRPGCHLCDEMKAVVARVATTMPVEVREVDISVDPALEKLYGLEIPVLLIAGVKAAKHRIAEPELVRILNARPRPIDLANGQRR